MSKQDRKFYDSSTENATGPSVIVPPSLHYVHIVPAYLTREECETILHAYEFINWGLRDIWNELRFKDGFLHSPQHYLFYQKEIMEIERYIEEIEAKIEKL